MSFSFDPAALNAILNEPSSQLRMQVFAQPVLLDVAKQHVGVQWAGQRNPGGAGNPPYRRSGLFQDTLQLEVNAATGALIFGSPATASRRSGDFDYGWRLIAGVHPYTGPYTMLPSEYYV